MRAKNNHIKNRDAYFKTVLKNMNLKETIKQIKIEDNEIFVEAPSICGDFLDNFDFEKELSDRNLLGWIDMIEDQKLYAAVKSLPIEEQTLLSYIFKECCTQTELAQIYNTTQQNISKRTNNIFNKIKNKFIKKGDF